MPDMTRGPTENVRDGRTDRSTFDKDRNTLDKKGDKDVEMQDKTTDKDAVKAKDTGTKTDPLKEKGAVEEVAPAGKTTKA